MENDLPHLFVLPRKAAEAPMMYALLGHILNPFAFMKESALGLFLFDYFNRAASQSRELITRARLIKTQSPQPYYKEASLLRQTRRNFRYITTDLILKYGHL